MTGAPAGLGELFKHSWNRSAIMRAVTCGAGPAGQGSPPRAPPTAGGSGVPAACTAACRRVREAPCIWGTSGLRGGGACGRCTRGRHLLLPRSVRSSEDKPHVKGAGGDVQIQGPGVVRRGGGQVAHSLAGGGGLLTGPKGRQPGSGPEGKAEPIPHPEDVEPGASAVACRRRSLSLT